MKRLGLFAALFGLAVLVLASCRTPDQAQAKEGDGPSPWAGVTKAVCVIHGTQGHEGVKGLVTFVQAGEQVKVVADLEGLSPGEHGFHIHEWGDCSAPDGASLGSHYDPEGHPHAGPMEGMRHAGDFGNVTADAQGKAHLELELTGLTLAGKNAIVGRGMVVHAATDDLKTQPTGNAGARIGVGTIGIAKP
jgi:Cu-Zn family superoxide dismutase